MTKTCSCALLLLLVGCGAGSSEDSEAGNAREPMLKLPMNLQEISGLAHSPGGHLLTMNDERAVVYEVRFDPPGVTEFARFGDPVSDGDFEGIAVKDEHLYLMTSDGKLLRQSLKSSSDSYDSFKTGLKKVCELEGLAPHPAEEMLLLLCKTPYKKGRKKSLLIYSWSTVEETLAEDPWLSEDYKDLGLPHLHPSGITFSADGENIVVVAARERYYAVLDRQGTVLKHDKLPNQHVHQQTEGVIATTLNTLYLADEGVKDRGTITQYERFF